VNSRSDIETAFRSALGSLQQTRTGAPPKASGRPDIPGEEAAMADDAAVKQTARADTCSARVRAALSHPIIDSDGHIIEFEAAVLDNLEAIAGRDARVRFCGEGRKSNNFGNYARMWGSELYTPEQRDDLRLPKLAFWGLPSKNTMDRCAATLPALLNERLDETGMDYSILYPTFGLMTMHLDDPELRVAASRAVNQYNYEAVSPFSKRLCSVGVIPMHTPEEAVAELEYAVKVQGHKVVVMPSYVVRPVPAAVREHPEIAHLTHWLDTYGSDSLYDYDPVWAKCLELGVNPTFHTPGYGFGTRTSPINFVQNHMGAFAAAGEGVARALMMDGVPHRFPTLKIGVLEGGVGWACMLLSDLLSHFAKRNKDTISHHDPRNLDMKLFKEMHAKWGGPAVQSRLDRVGKSEMRTLSMEAHTADHSTLIIDEFAGSGINSKEDIKRMFVEQFYFGCEADDPINVWAFNDKASPLGVKLKAMMASDIGHFDVLDITEVAEEAHEAVEHGLMSEDDFRAFCFENPAEFWTSGNRGFFKGASVEAEVDKLLAART
jgi:predicted TIM-barrel fold metal-dependent hydrolase